MCVTVIYCCITNHPQYLVAENNSYSFCSQNCNSGKVMTGLCPTWHRLLSGWHTLGDFPGHPAVNIALAMEGTQVRSLVGELRSHMLCSMAKIKKKKCHTHVSVSSHSCEKFSWNWGLEASFPPLPLAAWASLQYGSWIPRASVPREQLGSVWHFYELALELHNITSTLLVKAVTKALSVPEEGDTDSTLDAGVARF